MNAVNHWEPPAARADGFDPVMLAEICRMTDPPMTKQHARFVMGLHDAPEPVPLARGKVWRGSEVLAFVHEHVARMEADGGYDPDRRARRRDGKWAKEPPPEPPAEVLELREWISSGRAREIRRAAGLTCLAVAGRVGVSESTVERWETGRNFPGDPEAAAYHALLTRLAEGTGGG
jgi:DNA-binding transcriptional regulator YiaG